MAYKKRFMEKAYQLAQLSRFEGEVPVGCVITKGDEIVACGRNRRETKKTALGHAEIEAIEEACQRLGGWRLSDCDLYVTLEPCPMCAGAIINARIGQVYFGAYDAKGGACGSVVNLFSQPFFYRPAVEGGHEEEACQEQLTDFFDRLRWMKVNKEVTIRRFSNIDYVRGFPLFCEIGQDEKALSEVIQGGAEALSRFFSKGYPLVAHEKGKMVGLGSITIKGEILVLGVAADARRKHIGKKLLFTLEEKAIRAGSGCIWCQYNDESWPFFENAGYTHREGQVQKHLENKI